MPSAAVRGSGAIAAGWATRLLASGFDVTVGSDAVAEAVGQRWRAAERMGLFPGSSPDRLSVGHLDHADVVLDPADGSIIGVEPIHLVPVAHASGSLRTVCETIGLTLVGDHDLALAAAAVAPYAHHDDEAVAVLRALRATPHLLGRAVAHHEGVRLAAQQIRPWQPGDVPAAPLDLYSTRVEADWVDYNGHMTEAAYLTAAGWASDALFRYIGDDEAYRAAGNSFYTVETHIHYVAELAVHEPLRISTQLLGVDAKRLHFIHVMHHGDEGHLVGTCEQMLLHVDMHAGRSAPILPNVKAALDAIAASHAGLPVPPQVGSVMRLPPPRPTNPPA